MRTEYWSTVLGFDYVYMGHCRAGSRFGHTYDQRQWEYFPDVDPGEYEFCPEHWSEEQEEVQS